MLTFDIEQQGIKYPVSVVAYHRLSFVAISHSYAPSAISMSYSNIVVPEKRTSMDSKTVAFNQQQKIRGKKILWYLKIISIVQVNFVSHVWRMQSSQICSCSSWAVET